jgi:hypothetical protein
MEFFIIINYKYLWILIQFHFKKLYYYIIEFFDYSNIKLELILKLPNLLDFDSSKPMDIIKSFVSYHIYYFNN